MPVASRLRSSAVLLGLLVALAAPASSQATLVFTRNPLNPTIWVANDNGSRAKPLVKGSSPKISPDGKTVAYYRVQQSHGYRTELVVAPTDGKGSPRRLLANWSETFVFAWSPDSSTVAAVTSGERLVLIDVATGRQRTLAKGFFGGFSFSPDGTEAVFSKASSERYPPQSDVYRVALGSGKTVKLTRDRRSESPLWGPGGEIVFVKLLGADKRKYGPKGDLFLMNPEGGQVRRLTHTKVAPLLFGLSPVQWSAGGGQLLTNFGGQDTTYAVTVNPETGAERTLTKERDTGLVGAALSADGSTVLGSVGGFEPGPGHKVVSIPYLGGKPKTLAKNASEPDWDR